jgi:hypothetical protein
MPLHLRQKRTLPSPRSRYATGGIDFSLAVNWKVAMEKKNHPATLQSCQMVIRERGTASVQRTSLQRGVREERS